MPTPIGLTSTPTQEILIETADRRQSAALELVYFTNRGFSEPESELVPYGADRSRALAFGTATIQLGEGMDWQTLAELSDLEERERQVVITLKEVEERTRYPSEPYTMIESDRGLIRAPAVMEQHNAARNQIHEELKRQTERAQSGDVLLYVHGFNETFESAAATLAELCHFLRRRSVCVLFSWPASRGALLSYTETTETAEFAVGHLRKAIRAMARSADVERINLLAHSRGSPLLLSALRELMITSLASGEQPTETIKLHHVVLAAPDIDVDIAMRKFELFLSEPDSPVQWQNDVVPDLISGRFTTYLSPGDRALSISSWLFGGGSRVGVLNPLAESESVVAEDIAFLTKLGMVDVMVYEGERNSFFGHSYFTRDPAVSSDLISLLSSDLRPGSPGRPATELAPSVWSLR
ncbi:MAG: alpha/beta hydrolase [Pseudomonadota bacterium]